MILYDFIGSLSLYIYIYILLFFLCSNVLFNKKLITNATKWTGKLPGGSAPLDPPGKFDFFIYYDFLYGAPWGPNKYT